MKHISTLIVFSLLLAVAAMAQPGNGKGRGKIRPDASVHNDNRGQQIKIINQQAREQREAVRNSGVSEAQKQEQYRRINEEKQRRIEAITGNRQDDNDGLFGEDVSRKHDEQRKKMKKEKKDKQDRRGHDKQNRGTRNKSDKSWN